ncbi:MAG: hypothetical protein ACFE9L_13550 [Candidatus Hodarchaeota archaeon]
MNYLPDDIFILQTSGIPLFAKCFGGDYYKMHPDHSLQTGFLAAMYSFSKESFGQTKLKSIIFKDIKLDFKIDNEKEVILVFANPLEEKNIEFQLDKALSLFIEKYGAKLSTIIDEDSFKGFEQDLIENKIATRGAMGDIRVEERKKSLWKRFVSRFKREK